VRRWLAKPATGFEVVRVRQLGIQSVDLIQLLRMASLLRLSAHLIRELHRAVPESDSLNPAGHRPLVCLRAVSLQLVCLPAGFASDPFCIASPDNASRIMLAICWSCGEEAGPP
jgi:hypothetical protein